MLNKVLTWFDKVHRLYIFNSFVIIGWLYLIVYFGSIKVFGFIGNMIISIILGFIHFILIPVIFLILILISLILEFGFHLKIKLKIFDNKLVNVIQMIGFISFIIFFSTLLFALITS